jgi:hypothetical protein
MLIVATSLRRKGGVRAVIGSGVQCLTVWRQRLRDANHAVLWGQRLISQIAQQVRYNRAALL